jgi:hypothetical protein
VTAVTLALLSFATMASAATQVGFKDHAYTGFNAEAAGGTITGQKPESKLWINAGKWWAAMLSPAAAGAHTIWRLDTGGWVDTGVVIDTRPATKEDVLSLGNTLYIASRAPSGQGSNSLRRYTYSGGTYTLDTGFPVDIPGAGQETITLARDSLGNLWVTFESGKNIMVAHTTGNDTTWGTAFVLPPNAAKNVDNDDISAIISFTDNTGPAVGVLWSNQTAAADYFAIHRDGQPDATWSLETPVSGTLEADDHINLKTFEGHVYSVVKTNQSTSTATLVYMLDRSPTGTWVKHPVALKSEGNTRPITELNIDPTARLAYVFMTLGEGPSARAIVYKSAPLATLAFPSSATTFIQGANNEVINDATSTKQNTDNTTGIVVVASDGSNYWWNKLGGSQPSQPPTANATSKTTAEDTPAAVTLTGSDPDTCELVFSVVTAPAHGTVGTITNNACVNGNPKTDSASITYTPAANYNGPDSFTFLVNDGTSSSSPATVSLTVTAVNDAPVASAGSVTTPKNTAAPATLTGTDPETCELTFAIGTAPAHGSLGAVGNQACTAGSPNTDHATVQYTPAANYTGSDSFTYTVSDGSLTSSPATVSITVTSGATGITFRSASSGANAEATTLVLPAPPGVAAGDVMVAVVSSRGNPTITPPAGWTQVRVDTNGFEMRQGVYYKVAGAEPASYTFTLSQTQAAAGGIAAYSGVNTATPIDVSNGVVSAPKATAINAPSVTTTGAGDRVIGFFGMANNTSVTPPQGLTERFENASTLGTHFDTIEGCDFTKAAPGKTGAKKATTTATGYTIGQQVALMPA